MAAELTDIPSPPQWPILGHLPQLPRTHITQYLLEVSRQFPEGIFELNFGGIRVAFVYSAELVAELCDESRFRKVIRPPLLFLREVAADGLFTARSDEPNWGKAHRILMPAFGQRAMKSYFDSMLEVVQQLIAKWESREGADVLVADDMTRLTLDTIALTGFGYRFRSFESERVHPFIEAMVRVLSEAMGRLTRPPLLNRFGGSRRYYQDIALMNELVDAVIRQRREHPTDTNDLLNLMLTKADPETGEKLDDVHIRHQVITFLVAGHETTSGLLTFALYLLLRHPQVLAQAYAEVDRVLPGDTLPTYAHLAQLPVIERILKESLRLWPTAPAFTIAPYQTTVIGGRYRLWRDQTVSVQLLALHRDPKVWTRPEVFDVDRFLPEAEAKIPPHAYKPFGNGSRACIGRQFALTEARLALALILQRFALSDPRDYRFHVKETLTLKPDSFYLRVRRRRPNERIAVAATVAATVDEPEAAPRVSGAGRALTVLYGTNLGTSREVAEHVGDQARHMGFAAIEAPLDEYAEKLPEDGILIVVTATYNGKAPDTARHFADMIERGELAKLARPHLKYAVLGCGNSQWPNFQAFPRLVDETLAQTGAARLLARGEADGDHDFDLTVERWLTRLWKALGGGAAEDPAAAPRIAVRYLSATETRAAALPAGAQVLRVLANEELVRDPTGLWDFSLEAPRASTRHIVLELPDGLEYRTGDHLGIYPRNRPARVRALLDRLGIAPDTVVVLDGDGAGVKQLPLGRAVTAAQLLTDYLELQDPVSRSDVRRLLVHTRCPRTREELERLVGDDDAAVERFQREIADKHVSTYDLLQRFPAIELPFDAFLDLCSPIRPRFYSISSSPQAAPRRPSLTVSAVVGRAWIGEGEYKGVASAYLYGLEPGDEVVGFLRRPDPAFAPPEDPRVPMILVGPGTGFAPFRGFLQERAAQSAQGTPVAPALVFYGCRHPQHDWFYDDEMRRWEALGVARLYLAFSTVPSHPHRFVQDALWAERESVWNALETGAIVYVCGDGRFMAPAVRDTLIRIYADRTVSSHEQASNWLQTLINLGRYRQDVFGDV